jgi:hypothetical protein
MQDGGWACTTDIGRNPDQVRVVAVICPGLMALGASMYHPAAPTGSPYIQEQMEVASSPNPLTQLQSQRITNPGHS